MSENARDAKAIEAEKIDKMAEIQSDIIEDDKDSIGTFEIFRILH